MKQQQVLTATYRLQLRGPAAGSPADRFTFADAEAVIPYLAKLGISHIYLSPICTAPPSSSHGYDVVDPTTINPELGGMEGFTALVATARQHNLGVIIDIVPNHVGVAEPWRNQWWWDVLTFGTDSEYEQYFDIDWREDNGAGGKLGLPVLGADGIDAVTFDTVADQPVLRYHEHVFPIRPGTKAESPQATLHQQSYQLLNWDSGTIGYRRFFSVNDLAGIRQELPQVFEHTHRLLRELVARDLIDGVRVDHPDGLADPFEYLRRLREVIGDERLLVIEKILSVDEPLDPRLNVDGTTGYDALREFDGIFISREAESPLSMQALALSGSPWDGAAVQALEQALKREVAAEELAAEVTRLARACRRDNFSTAGRSVSDEQLKDTIVELVAAMPVYRADYISLSRVRSSVIAEMTRAFPSRRDALDLIAAALIAGGEASVRFAQVCGAVMAKGVEDTTFYRACRLVALQEVGGAPGRFGVGPAEFHLLQKERLRLWPQAMTTLSTHDTKRSEDVRARIVAFTDDPEAFINMVETVMAVSPPPDKATGYFLLQNLLGLWPADRTAVQDIAERMNAYAVKAIREAGVHSTWTAVDSDFEQAHLDWLGQLLHGPVTEVIADYVDGLVPAAQMISVGRKLLQLCAPGLPDIYQGTEFFDHSLVDPDNRRPVNYDERAAALSVVEQDCRIDAAGLIAPEDAPAIRVGMQLVEGDDKGCCETVVARFQATPEHGRWPLLTQAPDAVKQLVTFAALKVRRALPAVFMQGAYQPLFAIGPADAQVVGFARCAVDTGVPQVIACSVRRPQALARLGGWGNTTVSLPAGRWCDQLTGTVYEGTIDCAILFQLLPVALMVRLDTADE
ncbi:malto-oligosyltrehalose synthase [Corynebacterium choanae]|uniref:Maltooligosyl trehalose synthase n=1 Tax=Corynebacterium choanae TaxID=1862358 RepID=A0A3G6J4I2_9CORY|nr:malto-oligosyltrehalose synthase [Corynebacterium choanae]AZA12985.1 Maltooligosyl trehalose synthase [Corynebacterium choanae]